MKLRMRAKSLGNKITLITTAFVLAVSALTAVTPFVATQVANAINPNRCETEFSGSHQKCVRTLAELKAAISTPAYSQIILDDTIYTSEPILIQRPLVLNGHDEKIVFNGDASDWQGNFVVKVYNTAGVALNSLQLEGGDAGLQVNSSEVSLSGNMRFINHEFGNISVTKASSSLVTRAPKLSVSSAGVLAGDYNTTLSKPYVWIDTNAVADATVSSYFLRGINRTDNVANKGQHWYFVNPDLTGAIATVVETGDVFATPQEAIAAAEDDQTVRLEKNVSIDTALNINKEITFDGNNKTLTATYSHTGISTDNGRKNTVVNVSANNVTVKNLTTDNTSTGEKPHGVVVDKKTHVVFENVTLKNGRAGLIVNGSQVEVHGITTTGNSWYGINVDRVGASLDIDGVNAHDSAVYAIYAETESLVSISADAQYARIGNPVDKQNRSTDVAYVLKSAVPVATVTVNGQDTNVVVSDRDASDPVVIKGSSTGANANKSHWFKITAPNGVVYDWNKLGANTSEESFALHDVIGLPVDSKGRALDGAYSVRYVSFDSNNVRNDLLVSEIVTFTVDSTKPLVSASLSTDLVVLNGEAPTLTIDATDTRALDGGAQYRIQNTDGSGIAGFGWVHTNAVDSIVLSEVANLPDGEYRVNVRAFDTAGNKTNNITNVFVVDRSVASTIAVSSTSTTQPVISGVATYANDAPAANINLVITVDDEEYNVTTNASGVWTVQPTVSGSATGVSHEVTVQLEGAEATATPIALDSFVTRITTTLTQVFTVNPGTPQGAQGGTRTFAAATVTPTITAPEEGVQGAETENQGVESASTVVDDLAAAVDADNTNGNALGFAWYWWLLAIGGASLVGWWIFAAVRGRQGE